jgi:tRNA A-37 threonylcarbamoyl transferase component Bud32
MAIGLLLGPGDRLGKYVVDRFVAHGGTSEVWRASSAADPGVPIALKVFPRDPLRGSAEQRFLREATALAGVRHPHLAEVLDHGSSADGRLLFYAMRFVEGETLRRVLEECATIGPPTREHLRFLVGRVSEIADALDELHRRGLVHRDVKPGNIVLRQPDDGTDDDPSAVLVDYGLVRPVLSTAGDPSTLQASLSYAAPEHLRGEEVDGRVDVFGLGTTLYDLVRGKGPEARRRLPSFGLEPLDRLLPDVDLDLAAIVACATDVDPLWRYRSARAFGDDLKRWLDGRPVLARRTSAQRLRRWVAGNPHRLLRWLARTAMAALVLASIGFATLESRRLLQARDQARSAWRAGDLATTAESMRLLPSWLDRWSLPDDLRATADSLRGNTRDVGVAAVILSDQRDGPVAATLAAVTALARNPPRDDDPLVRFVAFRVGEAAQSDSPEMFESLLRIVARYCNESPDDSAQRVRASAPLRAVLEQSLGHSDPGGADGLLAVSTLSGCGVPATAAPLLEWILGRVEQGTTDPFEACRLALRCLERIVARSRQAGFGEDVIAPTFLALVATLQARAESIHASLAAGDVTLLRASGELLAELEFLRRALGRTAGERVGFGSREPLVLSAARDEQWRRALLDRVELAPDVGPGANCLECDQLGVLASAFGERALIEDVRARVLACGRARSLDADWLAVVFDRAVLRTQQRADGTWLDTGVDPETTLREAGNPAPSREMRPALIARPDPLESDTVEWNFLRVPFESHGESRALLLVDATIGEDEFDRRDGRFVLLGIPGRSECRFEFQARGDGVVPPLLEIDAQKGARAGLPWFGEARLECLLDGVQIVEALAPTQIQVEWRQALPLLRGSGRELHSLVLRLAPESSTTLRLFRVRIGRPSRPR